MDLKATRKMARNPQLRLLLSAWTGFYIADYAYTVLVIVMTFSSGGAAAVGAATVLGVLPAGVLGPLAATLATSRRPQLHLAIGIGARALVMAATIVAVLSGAPIGVLLALVGIDSLVSVAVRPLHGALIVRLADTAIEAAAANAATSSLLSLSMLAGPALAGLALGLVGIGWAFALPGVIYLAGMGAALMIKAPAPLGGPEIAGDRPGRSARFQLSTVGVGLRAIVARPPAAAATTVFVLTVTLLGVWYVACASVADERLGLGQSGVTTIMTLFGAGGLLGALATLSIVGRRGLAIVAAVAMLAFGVTLAGTGTIPVVIPALALAAGVGAAGAVAYAIVPTLVQRSIARDAMVPASATLQSLYLIGVAAGAAITPLLIGFVGVTVTLAIVGGAAVLTTALAWPQLRKADALSDEDLAKLAVIRATPMLAPLTGLALEQLARAATRVTVPAGTDVVTQGEYGDRFYMIAAGLAGVTVDGRSVATLGPGGSFGEIALLHDVPRSASVTAREDLDLVAVDRAEFLGALSSETGAVGRIGGVARTRLLTRPTEERLVDLDRNTALRGQSVAQLLASQPPLAAIGADAVRQLAHSARVVAVPNGALITREGDFGDTFYVILDGAAEVLEGPITVRNLFPGDGFGEQAILSDAPQAETVRAVGDTRLVAVDRAAFQRARQGG